MSLSNDDQVFLLTALCQNERDSIDWDNLERFLRNYQGVRGKDRVLEILRPLAVPEDGRPYAFWSWLGLYASTPNALEAAIVENSSDHFFALLDDREKMLEMGYLAEEIPAIRTRLENNAIQGPDNYFKAQRLIGVLGYQNKAAAHPEVWFLDGVLRLLAAADETNEPRWKTLLEWHRGHPFEFPNPFEKALENGAQDEIHGFLEDEEGMEAWGYTRDQVKNMKAVSVSWPEEHDRESVSEVSTRISQFQGNQHRFLDDYLLRQMEHDLTAPRKALFALMRGEKRYQEVIAYYREDPGIFCLRCLIALRDFDAVSKEVSDNPKLPQKDQKLTQDVFQLANACGHHEFADQMPQVVNRIAWNRFEENLIKLNAQIIQEMVGDQARGTILH